jgi:ribonuclease HI
VKIHYNETTFTFIMSRPNVGIDRGMKLATSSQPTPLLYGTFFEELRQTRSLFTGGSKSAVGPFGGFSICDYTEDKDWGYRTSQMASIFTLEAMAISESLTRFSEIQGCNFNIFSDSRSVTTAISLSKNFGKRSPLISHIKEQLEEAKTAGKHVKIHWIPAHGGITGNEKADGLAKYSNRHGRDSQIPVPAEDMRSLWRKKAKEESQLWHQEVGRQ